MTNSETAIKEQIVAGQEKLRESKPSCAKMSPEDWSVYRKLDKVRRHLLNEAAEVEAAMKEIVEKAA